MLNNLVIYLLFCQLIPCSSTQIPTTSDIFLVLTFHNPTFLLHNFFTFGLQPLIHDGLLPPICPYLSLASVACVLPLELDIMTSPTCCSLLQHVC
jgi:hypothetical protein